MESEDDQKENAKLDFNLEKKEFKSTAQNDYDRACERL